MSLRNQFSIFLVITLSVSMQVASMMLNEFASKPFVRQALAKPSKMKSVLTFFFGVDYSDPSDIDNKLRKGKALFEMQELWYKGGPEYDKLCQPFADTIRAAGKGNLSDWNSSVDGVVAQMVLCDQLSRNVFRGTSEAYAYDSNALDTARILSDSFSSMSSTDSNLQGEFFPPYLSFVVTALMHSESLSDHDSAISLLKLAKEHCSDDLRQQWDFQESFELEHKAVVDRFGRYPHRNSLHGRECTPEEEEWLADVDNLPKWALSQLPSTSKET